MEKTFREKLRDCCNDYSESIEPIIELIKSDLISEEMAVNDLILSDAVFGFNTCREEMLKKLEN